MLKSFTPIILALAAVLMPAAASAQRLTGPEQRIASYIDTHQGEAIALLERIVNINSGSLNEAGVRRVYEALRPEFEAIGFEVRYVPGADNRAGHLVASRRGNRGKKLLLIGHLDTVFEESSPFQRFTRLTETHAKGPGVDDMKGGDVIMLQALKALHSVGALEGTSITVVMTGDEESPGKPLDAARRALIEAGKEADIALGFEGGSQDEQGTRVVVGRRSSSGWRLNVTARPAHSSGVFRDAIGAGAIYEASRILHTFYSEIRGEENLTFNPGLIAGGTEVTYDTAAARATTFGKTNVIAEHALVTGDIRTISDEQLQRTRERMRAIVARSLPGARAEITFSEGYPAMAPTAANQALLATYGNVSQALGLGPVLPHDPARRGAADISFVAPHIEAGIDGLGAFGTGAHTVEETVDLRSLATQAKRAALLIYRLTR